MGASVGTVGASVGTAGASVGTAGASVGTVGASVGTAGASVGTVGASVGTVGASVGTAGASVGTAGASDVDVIGSSHIKCCSLQLFVTQQKVHTDAAGGVTPSWHIPDPASSDKQACKVYFLFNVYAPIKSLNKDSNDRIYRIYRYSLSNNRIYYM